MTATIMRYRGLGVPPDRTPEPPQKDSKLEEALQQYRRFCVDAAKKQSTWSSENFYDIARNRITTVLNPLETSLFLIEIAYGREDPLVKSSAVTALIHNAYADRLHSFAITIPENLETFEFGAQLCGTKEQPYNLRIMGDLGGLSFRNSKNVNAIVKGNCGPDTAYQAKSVFLEFEELPCYFDRFFSMNLGYEAENSIFRFQHINEEIISRIRLHPKILQKAHCCKLQLYTQDDFEQFKRLHIPTRQGHKIQLVKEGTIEVIEEVLV